MSSSERLVYLTRLILVHVESFGVCILGKMAQRCRDEKTFL